MNFSTIVMDGLLFWSATSNGAQFLGLGIEGGHIKLASNLLDTVSSTLDVPTGGFVADGGWHNVQISMDKRTIQLSVDGRPIFTENKRTPVNVSATIQEERNGDEATEFVAGDMENMFYIGECDLFGYLRLCAESK